MGSGLSQKYNNTYGSIKEDTGSSTVREETVEYSRDAVIVRKSNGTSNINDNVSKMSGKFAPNEHGHFGGVGKNTRIIKCDDPIKESASFYEQIGRGGEVRQLPRRNGTITELDDKTQITYRVITKSEGSPAVQINVQGVHTNIRDQKIHFIKE